MKMPFENSPSLHRLINHLSLAALLLTGAIFSFAMPVAAQDYASEKAGRRTRTVTQRRVFVRSTSLLVRGAVVEDKLLKNSDFRQMGFVITRDPRDADIVLELRHDLLTKYVFSVVDLSTQTVIASGKLSSLGGTVAGKVAKRFVKEMSKLNQP